MKVGLYFGSFNPVHTGHLIIANHALNETDIDECWFVISPQNPFKQSSTLLDEYDRMHLLRLAISEDQRMKVCDIEFSLPKPSYTSVTLSHLADKYPDSTFSILMGSDSFQNLNKWKNYETIIANYHIYIYERPGFKIENSIGAKMTTLQAPLLQISATDIRKLIQENKSIRYLVPDQVREEIEKTTYYRK